MGDITVCGHARWQLRAGVSLLALTMGMVAVGSRQAAAAACGSGSGSSISAACTGPFTWNGGNLTNSGTISGGANGVVVSANTGTLTNSGTIDGTTSGLVTSGTVQSIVNTGTINGQSDFGISGGNGGTNGKFGTISNGAFGTISGGQAGLYFDQYSNGADLIINAGKISSTDTGIKVDDSSVTIGSISNSGTITGATGISNIGVITSLTNSGTISGTTAAIDNSGTLGTITNSGVISGNIVNSSTNALTINGASASGSYGTLTGGSISNTSSSLVFGSGNLLLEDNVDVTGRTLSNTGATVKVTSATIPTITGTYNQSGGGLVVGVTSSSSYGYLNVTGNATMSGSTVTLSGTTMQAGETYTVVRSGATGSYTGNSASISGRGGLTASLSTSSNNLLVTLAAKDYSTIGGGGSGSLGGTLSQIAKQTSATATAFQTSVLAPLDALSASQQSQAIKQLAPTQNAPSAQMGSAAASAVLGAVEQHQQTAMAYAPETGKAAGSDSHDASLWGQFLGGGAIRSTTAAADGYKTLDFGLAFGIDNRFTPNVMAGLALSWVRALSQGLDNSSGSSTTLDNFQLTQYGTLREDRVFMDWQLAVGWNRFDQKRAIAFLGRTAKANYDGQQYLAKAKFGYDFAVMGATVTPMAGWSWSRAVTASYTENGAGSANLTADRRGVNSVSQTLGAKTSTLVNTAWGVLKPEARVEWIHDYTQGAISTSGLMGGEAYTSTSSRLSPDGARLGLAATLNTDGDWSFRSEYEAEVRPGYQNHTGLLKAIMGF